MARISGLGRSTIYHGLSEIRAKTSVPTGRVRKEGSGRKQDPTLGVDRKRLLAPITRARSDAAAVVDHPQLAQSRERAGEQRAQGLLSVFGDLLGGMGYSLQANRKTREGGYHIDRDAQFQYINAQAKIRRQGVSGIERASQFG